MDQQIQRGEASPRSLDDLALAYYVPEENEPLEEVAKKFYAVSEAKHRGTAMDTVVEALRVANPRLTAAIATSGDPLIIPIVAGVSPVAACRVPRPTLPDTVPAPNPAPLENPPLSKTEKVGEAHHVSHPRPGCVYFWEFFKKYGPLQEQEFLMGTTVWVRFGGRTSFGVGPFSGAVLALYCVLEANRVVVRRWQWQEIWGVFRVLCAEPGTQPARSSGTHQIEGKWVLLPELKRTQGERLVKCSWDITPNSMIQFADSYTGSAEEIERGADELQ